MINDLTEGQNRLVETINKVQRVYENVEGKIMLGYLEVIGGGSLGLVSAVAIPTVPEEKMVRPLIATAVFLSIMGKGIYDISKASYNKGRLHERILNIQGKSEYESLPNQYKEGIESIELKF